MAQDILTIAEAIVSIKTATVAVAIVSIRATTGAAILSAAPDPTRTSSAVFTKSTDATTASTNQWSAITITETSLHIDPRPIRPVCTALTTARPQTRSGWAFPKTLGNPRPVHRRC